ncbi:DUF4367 domain-containing protein [Methanosarcina sp. WWM596]|uniref:DUF4367 domain-containing protein n=1 Tax=Methanosarcina sp. WWM596 TaxID=1434103 RepID=UPI000615CBB0|nr:DUF4367 domain-containing protein [Methanosarcina sp. WWM596]AKB19219.1 hypothetical protein MSWHS_2356 [Methanosarcina sp. WWM596]
MLVILGFLSAIFLLSLYGSGNLPLRMNDVDNYGGINREMTLEEAKQLTDFKILIPEYLPEGYEFNYSTASSGIDTPYSTFLHSGFSIFAGYPREKFTLVYTNGEDEIRIVESISEQSFPETQDFESEGEPFLVNNKSGTISSVFEGNMKSLTWQDGELEITIISSLDKGELLNIAESFS